MIKLVYRSGTYPLRYFDAKDSPAIVLTDLVDCGTGRIPWRFKRIDEEISSKMKHKLLPFPFPSWMNLLVFSVFIAFMAVHLFLLMTLIFSITSLFNKFDLVSTGVWAITFFGLAYLLLNINKYWCKFILDTYPSKIGLSITEASRFWEDNRLFFSSED